MIRAFAALTHAVGMLCVVGGMALAQDSGRVTSPTWRPELTETLIKLPASALARRIDQDLEASSLGRALREQDERLQQKLASLGDLTAALKLAQGEQRRTLEHHLLVEKEQFIGIAAERNRLARRELAARKAMLEDLLAKLGAAGSDAGPDRRELLQHRTEARQRLEASVVLADRLLDTGPLAQESRYSGEYGQKRAAIEALRQKVAEHPLSQAPVVDGKALSKAEYVRHLVVSAEGALSLLGMEEEMLGYMAKLVSLDALALAETMGDPELADSARPEPFALDQAIDFFVN